VIQFVKKETITLRSFIQTAAGVLVTVVGLTAAVLGPAFEADGAPPHTAPEGDLNQDGSVDAVDVQCLVLVFIQEEVASNLEGDACGTDADCTAEVGLGYTCRTGFSNQLLCLPPCLSPSVSLSGDEVDCPDPEADTPQCNGLVPRRIADLNCDSVISNTDFLFLVAVALDKLGGAGTADVDDDGRLNFCDDDTDGDGVPDLADGCPVDADPLLLDTDGDLVGDACDPDDDGDGDPDVTDCDPLSALAANGLPEVCDGFDNDCDGNADEGCPDSVTAGFVAAGLVQGPPADQNVQITVGQTAIGAVLTPDASASLGLGPCATAGE